MAIQASRMDRIRAASRNILDSPHEAHQESEDEIDSVQEVLSLPLRITCINSLDRDGFVSQVLAINLADNLGAYFVSRRLQIYGLERAAREYFEPRLRVGNDLPIYDIGDCIQKQVGGDTRRRHPLRIQEPAAYHNVELIGNQASNQGRYF
jgi:hypothetical protein